MHALEFLFAFGLGAALCLACVSACLRVDKWEPLALFWHGYVITSTEPGRYIVSPQVHKGPLSLKAAKRACEAHAKAREAQERKDGDR